MSCFRGACWGVCAVTSLWLQCYCCASLLRRVRSSWLFLMWYLLAEALQGTWSLSAPRPEGRCVKILKTTICWQWDMLAVRTKARAKAVYSEKRCIPTVCAVFRLKACLCGESFKLWYATDKSLIQSYWSWMSSKPHLFFFFFVEFLKRWANLPYN